MSKHYIIRLRETELWVDSAACYGHGDMKYFAVLKKDPLRVTRYDTWEEAEKFAEERIPEGHWVIHRLIPKTELTPKPDAETFVLSDAQPKEDLAPVPVPVRVVEVDEGLLARFNRRWFT